MEDLFRLVLHRPAIEQDQRNPSIDLTQESPYQNALRHAITSGGLDTAAVPLSQQLMASPRFLGDPTGNPYAAGLASLGSALDDLTDVDPTTVQEAIEQALGDAAGTVVAQAGFDETVQRLRDSVVAIKAVQEEHSRPVEALVGQLRLMQLVARVAADPTYPDDAEVLAHGLRRSLRLPGDVKITSRISTRKQSEERRERHRKAREERAAQVEQLVASHDALRAAILRAFSDVFSLELSEVSNDRLPPATEVVAT